MNIFEGLKLCKNCEHYTEQEINETGIVEAVCDKYDLQAKIKKGHTLFCIHSDNDCPVCGYPLKLIHSSTGDYYKCNTCGCERAKPF